MDKDLVKARFEELQPQMQFSARGLSDELGINRYSINKVLSGDLHTRKLRMVFHSMLKHMGLNEDQFYKRQPILPPAPKREAEQINGRIPMYGEIPAGHTNLCEGFPHTNQWFDPAQNASTNRVFALRVYGDSMSPRLLQGDTVILEPRDVHITIKDVDRPAPGLLFEKMHGRIVSALVDGEATLKVLEYVPKKETNDFDLYLVPLNPIYSRLYIKPDNEFRIQGVVIGSFRNENSNHLSGLQKTGKSF